MNTPTVGDWYAVSLDESGWAACYVGRVTSEGWMLGYFFGPWSGQPTSADVAGCTAEQATFVLVVSRMRSRQATGYRSVGLVSRR